jgi:uncharacterized protein
VFFADRLTLDASRRTKDGYLAVRAKAARTGVYAYDGTEIDPDNKHGLRDAGTVHVLRDEATVFDEAAVRSFIGKPITDDHPMNPVTAANWKDHARGMVMGAKWEEGGYLAFDLLLTDAATIKKVDEGKRELSNGYATELEFGDFAAPDGTKCAARQVKISGNHVALVDRGRAGAECRIADAASCDTIPRTMLAEMLDHMLGDERTYNQGDADDKNGRQRRETVDNGVSQMGTKTITFDNMPIEATDQSEAAIRKLEGQLADSATRLTTADKALKDEQAKVVERDATITAKDAKITELEGQLKDAAITPAKLQDAAKEYADVCGKAKALGVTFAEDADLDAVKKAVVDAKMGDAAKDYSAEHIAIAFDALVKDAKVDPVRDTIVNGVKHTVVGRGTVETARKAWLADKAGAYRKPVAQGAN